VVAETLALISSHLHEINITEPIREFLWVAFSSLILAKTSVANARDIIHSRHHYWQHNSSPNVLDRFETRIATMRRQMADFKRQCGNQSATEIQVRLGDARALRLPAETIDLVFTSPPYVTALDYPPRAFLSGCLDAKRTWA